MMLTNIFFLEYKYVNQSVDYDMLKWGMVTQMVCKLTERELIYRYSKVRCIGLKTHSIIIINCSNKNLQWMLLAFA